MGCQENSFDHTRHSRPRPLPRLRHPDELGFISARRARVLVVQLDLLDCCLHESPSKMPPTMSCSLLLTADTASRLRSQARPFQSTPVNFAQRHRA
jgi:hypothetical protein